LKKEADEREAERKRKQQEDTDRRIREQLEKDRKARERVKALEFFEELGLRYYEAKRKQVLTPLLRFFKERKPQLELGKRKSRESICDRDDLLVEDFLEKS
jgi:hypothetical protein